MVYMIKKKKVKLKPLQLLIMPPILAHSCELHINWERTIQTLKELDEIETVTELKKNKHHPLDISQLRELTYWLKRIKKLEKQFHKVRKTISWILGPRGPGCSSCAPSRRT
jgi:hypothetical protein